MKSLIREDWALFFSIIDGKAIEERDLCGAVIRNRKKYYIFVVQKYIKSKVGSIIIYKVYPDL